MTFQDNTYQIADELRAIASAGLHFAVTDYDRERYQRILYNSARMVAALERRSPDEVEEEYEGNLSHISPLLGASAAVIRHGRILLIKREDNGLWAMPGGFTDVGETWARTAERELWEEAIVRGTAVRLLGIFDSRLWKGRSRFHMYSAVFEIGDVEGEPSAGPETTDIGFFREDELPDLSRGHNLQVPHVFKQLRGVVPVPHFDPADNAADMP